MFAALLALVMSAPAVLAQEKPATPEKNGSNNNQGDRGNRGGDRGNRGGGPGGGFDTSRFTDMIKERVGAPEDEWKVIEPKLTKVIEARRETMSSMFGGYRRRGSDSSSSSDTTAHSATEKASRELRDVLDKKESTTEEVTAKLTAFREAREKAKQTLASAQKELKDILSPRQEAVLVSMGMLD